MDRIQGHLLQLSDDFDKKGKIVCADAVDSLIKSASVQKVAQYVGVIGYVLKQNRAMSNCIRRKKADSRPMQEVILECLKEYQDGQNYNNTEWASKYAQVITSNPTLIETSHVDFLKSIAAENDISTHIANIRNSAKVLQVNNETDSMLTDILAHFDQLASLIKEGSSENFFKEAAPNRSRWSRFWNPTERSWSNPVSWLSFNVERGVDKQTQFEMSEVLKNIENIKYNVQRMKTGISRIKSEVGSYTSGSRKQLGPNQESNQIVRLMVSKINNLDLDDWHKTTVALEQLRHLIGNRAFRNVHNAEIFQRSKQMITDISTAMTSIYDSISTTQELMRELRQRATIVGREQGLQGAGGERNPYAMHSPAEEYASLDRVLNQLYRNPFDDKAIWYAEKLHGRLDDKLRYIQRPEDQEISEWARNKEAPQPASPASPTPSPTPGATKPGATPGAAPSATLTPTPGTPTPATPQSASAAPVFNQQAVQSAINYLNTNFPNPADKDTIEKIVAGLSTPLLSIFGNTTEGRDAVTNLITMLIDGLKKTPQPAGATPQPATNKPTEQGIVGGLNADANKEENWPPSTAVKHPLPPRLQHMTVFDLVKIADALDSVDSRIADIMDEIIKKHRDITIDSVEFPEYSFPIKQEIVSKKDK